MTQNIYDDAEFFESYGRLERSVEGLAGAAEWPDLRAMLPDLRGLRIVDLGCGYGWFCRWAREQGAARVHGFDVSDRMLARAAAMTADDGIIYARADLERLGLPARSFDLAFSSLALHYVTDIARLLATVHQALHPGGRLVFSVEHPINTAPLRPGWSKTAEGEEAWPLDSYLVEGRRVTDWLGKRVVKQHRTIASQLNLLIGLGFAISHVVEWGPSDEQIAAHPDWAKERHRPLFLLIAARK
jgi:SAM-dependent methyltransferase